MAAQLKWVLMALILSSCSGGGGGSNAAFSQNSNEWLVPENQVRDGGPGPDGIPSLDSPGFLKAGEPITIDDQQLVVGIRIGNENRAYPHNILDWHEVVNDEFGSGDDTQQVTLSYCPLTGSSLLWRAFEDSANSTFGTSGLLFNSNLVLYDRETSSLWSQMRQQAVNGPKIASIPNKLKAIETTWGTWKTMYPDTEVLSQATGFSRDYTRYPYGGFRTNTDLLFSVANFDSRLHPKERVVGINVEDQSKAYQISGFNGSPLIINETINGLPVVAAGSATQNYAVIYARQLDDGTQLTFSSSDHELPVIMQDDEGNQWDAFGVAVSGPRAGEQLAKTDSFIAYWFAWGTFFPNTSIHF